MSYPNQPGFFHSRQNGQFVYMRLASPTSGYALGYEMTRPPLAQAKVVLYAMGHGEPIVVGHLGRTVWTLQLSPYLLTLPEFLLSLSAFLSIGMNLATTNELVGFCLYSFISPLLVYLMTRMLIL
jgi:hypothetical protein